MSVDEGIDLGITLGIKFFETSAKEAVNVEKAFTTLSKEAISKGIVQRIEINLDSYNT